MKPFLSLLVLTALLLTTVPSEARSRRGRGAAKNRPTQYYGGGSLGRDRGISTVEASAVGAVIHEVAQSPAPPKIEGAPQRKRSADYYRVFAKRNAAVAATKSGKPGKPGRAVFRPKPQS